MGSGKRDFSEFNAKLEKHLERLPDYAQRAQRKLNRYLPPQDGSGQRPADGQSPRPNRPPLSIPQVDLSMVSDVRDKWARWNEPAAKLERRKRRTSRAFTLWIVLSILSVLYAVAGYTGLMSGNEGFEGAFGGITATVIFGTLMVRSGLKLRRLHRVELPASTLPPPLPPTASAARRPMERLAESEASLSELLGQLTMPAAGAPAAVPEVSVEDARATANDAAATLRALADRIQAVERARDTASAADRAALESAVRSLREQLDDGLDGYGALVAAAGRAVAASSGGVQPAKDSLTDATDRLAGLALALRELS
ncbi:phage shock envelope stress response protein PspM [Qaidamihabitans albus]|uniref:phage shock envelope stress response protein PspM n=1 Tax=Qaidamihabitans albus TaxID=2795733 RepID=UPI0018F1E402|nr:hypothetical protein [Qaidamihabitans albus]